MLGKSDGIWEKVKNSIWKKFDSEPVYNKKYLRTKIKLSCKGKVNTNFDNNKILKEGSQFTCLSGKLIDLVYRKDKNFYLKIFSEQCKYVVKEKKISKFITDNIEIFSDDSDKEDSDEENSDEKVKYRRSLLKYKIIKKK